MCCSPRAAGIAIRRGSAARITRSRARERETDGRKRPWTTKGDDTLCSTLFSVYFSTSISPIRYRSFVNIVLRMGSIIVWHPHLFLFLFLCLWYSLSLSHIFIALDTIVYVSVFPPLPPLSCRHRRPPAFFFLASILLFSLFSFFIPHLSFDLTRPDRPVHVCTRNNYIQLGSFFFLSGSSCAAWKWIDLLSRQNRVPSFVIVHACLNMYLARTLSQVYDEHFSVAHLYCHVRDST